MSSFASLLADSELGQSRHTAAASTVAASAETTTSLNTPLKAKKASVPRGVDPSKVTLADALKYLSLPRNLGKNEKTGKDIIASMGRFGPYVMEDGDFRSVKAPDDVYSITLERALELLAKPKATRNGRFVKKKV